MGVTYRTCKNNIRNPETTLVFHQSKQVCFWKTRIGIFGPFVMHQGVKVDNKKIEAMVVWPQPTNITELHEFLGLTSYCRKFF